MLRFKSAILFVLLLLPSISVLSCHCCDFYEYLLVFHSNLFILFIFLCIGLFSGCFMDYDIHTHHSLLVSIFITLCEK